LDISGITNEDRKINGGGMMKKIFNEIWNSKEHKKSTEMFNMQPKESRAKNALSLIFDRIQELEFVKIELQNHISKISKRQADLFKYAQKEFKEIKEVNQ